MPVTIFEKGNSRGGTNKSLSRSYFVEGTDDEATIIDAVLGESPDFIGGLIRTGVSLSELDDSCQLWEASAQYGELSTPETDAVEYRFNFQAPSAHIYQSLSTISRTAASGTARNFKGAINVVKDGASLRVEGYSVAPPPETFTLAYYPATTGISTAYQNTVEGLVGLVNSVSFKGRPAGSLMLTRASGGARSNSQWSIEFGFAFIANRTSLAVGDITVPSKDGMDLLWCFYDDDNDTSANGLIKLPKSAHVERIWYRGDFGALAI